MAFSPDSRTLASACNKTVHLWDIATRSCQQALGYSDDVRCIAFSPDGKTLALALVNHTILLWDIETRSYQQMLEGQADDVESITFSPDGRYLATAYELFELKSTSISSKLRPEPNHAVVHREWVILNGKESLWLPIGRRWPHLAVYGNTIVLGHYSGKVTFIEVDFARIPMHVNRN
ncbi:putative wd40 repeat pf20 [Trichoderma evansii]